MQLLQLIATLALQFLLKISLHVRKLFSQSCSSKKRRITSMTNSHYYDARIYAFHVLATQHVLVLHRLTILFGSSICGKMLNTSKVFVIQRRLEN